MPLRKSPKTIDMLNQEFRLLCSGCRMDMYPTDSSSGRGIAETWYIAIMIKTCDKSNSFEEIEKLLAMET